MKVKDKNAMRPFMHVHGKSHACTHASGVRRTDWTDSELSHLLSIIVTIKKYSKPREPHVLHDLHDISTLAALK